jgi:hypothetical protein
MVLDGARADAFMRMAALRGPRDGVRYDPALRADCGDAREAVAARDELSGAWDDLAMKFAFGDRQELAQVGLGGPRQIDSTVRVGGLYASAEQTKAEQLRSVVNRSLVSDAQAGFHVEPVPWRPDLPTGEESGRNHNTVPGSALRERGVELGRPVDSKWRSFNQECLQETSRAALHHKVGGDGCISKDGWKSGDYERKEESEKGFCESLPFLVQIILCIIF